MSQDFTSEKGVRNERPPDPEMQRAARQGDPNCKTDFKKPEEITETTADIQARCLVRLYAMSLSTAAPAYGVVR